MVPDVTYRLFPESIANPVGLVRPVTYDVFNRFKFAFKTLLLLYDVIYKFVLLFGSIYKHSGYVVLIYGFDIIVPVEL